MLYVNDQYYTQDVMRDYECQFASHPILKHCDQYRIAVCPSDIGLWIALVLYVKKRGGTVLPLHVDTPRAQAMALAKQAQCHYLFYQSVSDVIHLRSQQSCRVGTLIQLSSGTTGAPKVIERSWQSVDEELHHYNARFTDESWQATVVACPTTHAYGLISGVLAALKRESRLVIVANANPKYVLKKLQQVSSYLLYAGPTLLYTLARLQRGSDRLDAVMTSGAPLPAAWLKLLHARTKRMLQQYGCSEVGCISLNLNVAASEEVGHPLSHLYVTSGTAAQPEEIVVHVSGCVVHTNDIGYANHDGELHFCERRDDVINVAGLLVYPGQVENVLRKCADLQDVVVFREKDTHAGERVGACFTATRQVAREELVALCQEHLAPYQVPNTFIQVATITRGQNGKVNRKQWAEVYQ